MKKNVVISLVLAILMALGWVTQILDLTKTQGAYNEHLAAAEAYREKGLFQKAIYSYEDALALKEVESTRAVWLEVYRQAYDDGVVTANEYGKAIQLACDKNGEKVSNWETLVAFYLETSNYTSAYEGYVKSEKAGASSELLTELGNEAKYSFTTRRKTYKEYNRSPEGQYAVRDDRGWGALDANGDDIVDSGYAYVSPFSLDGTALYISDKGIRLINNNRVVEAILATDIVSTRAYAEGLVPVCLADSNWRYLDCTNGEFVLEKYQDASNFSNGIAAVRTNGKWSLIDTSNNVVCEKQFDEIRLHQNGDYLYKGVMIASENGVFGMYNDKGERLNEFSCKNADVYMGGAVAFCNDEGKWGFVDKKGNVVIEPSFAEARSFSNGLAAIYDGNAWGYINARAEMAIDCQYLKAEYFSKNGVAMVSTYENLYNLIKLRFT